jgi:hypothetical protein
MKPSDHLKIGECPYCHAEGEIENVLFGMRACPLCRGRKTWPPPDPCDKCLGDGCLECGYTGWDATDGIASR